MTTVVSHATIKVAALAIVGVLGAGVVAQEAGQPKPITDAEAYAVYATLLPNQWSVTAAKATTLVFQAETTTYSQCEPSGPPIDGDWRTVMDAYRRENATARLLLAGHDLGVPYLVVSAADIKSAFIHNPSEPSVVGWDRFYQRYPKSGGVMAVSAVGFDASRSRAMVYMGHSCNDMCGGGTYYFLEKVNATWREARVAGLRNCGWAS